MEASYLVVLRSALLRGRAETAPSVFWFCGRMMAVSRRGEEQNQTWQNPNLAFRSVAIVNRGEAV